LRAAAAAHWIPVTSTGMTEGDVSQPEEPGVRTE
jgi:hypothetical protein